MMDKYSILRYISRVIPEGSFKSYIRVKVLDYRTILPKELFINKGDVVTLVGSPSPKSLERMCKSVGKLGKVILIEPDKQNLEKHYNFISLNNLKNITIVPNAAFNKKGKAKFYVAPNPADHRLIIAGIEHDNDYIKENYYIKVIDIEVNTIDNIMHDLHVGNLDYIEIQVNGAEFHVLRGMEYMLDRTKRIYVKGHARNVEDKTPIFHKIIPFLENRGFNTKLTLPSRTTVAIADWEERQGDVFGWKG